MKKFEYEAHLVKDGLMEFLNKKGEEHWQMVAFDRNPQNGSMVRVYLMREKQKFVCSSAKDCWKDSGCHHREPHDQEGLCDGPCPHSKDIKCVPYTSK